MRTAEERAAADRCRPVSGSGVGRELGAGGPAGEVAGLAFAWWVGRGRSCEPHGDNTAALVALAGVTTALGVLLARRFARRARIDGENEIVGWMFSGIVVVGAVFLAFVVFSVHERYSALRVATTDEAAQLVVVYRDTQTFVGPAKIHAQAALRQYANDVMNKEWKSHGRPVAPGAGP